MPDFDSVLPGFVDVISILVLRSIIHLFLLVMTSCHSLMYCLTLPSFWIVHLYSHHKHGKVSHPVSHSLSSEVLESVPVFLMTLASKCSQYSQNALIVNVAVESYMKRYTLTIFIIFSPISS